MRLKNSFTPPEEDPIVPEGLLNHIANLLRYTEKIDLKRQAGKGWRNANTLYIEGTDDENATDVATILKAYADYHCGLKDGGRTRYRVLVWARQPHQVEAQRHRFTFFAGEEDCEADAEEDIDRHTRAAQNETTEALYRALLEALKQQHDNQDRLVDRVITLSDQSTAQLEAMAMITKELGQQHVSSLTTQANAVRELGELRIEAIEASARTNENSQMWEALKPVLTLAAANAAKKLIPGQAQPRQLPERAANGSQTKPRQARDAHELAKQPPEASTPSVGQSQEEPEPVLLHELAHALLGQLGCDLVVLLRSLTEEQAGFLEAVVKASNEDQAADAIVGLLSTLMSDPTALAGLQSIMSPPQIVAFRNLGLLAQRHVQERDNQSAGPVPPSKGDTGPDIKQ